MDCSTCIFADTRPPIEVPFGLLQCGCKVKRLDTLVKRGEASLAQSTLEGEQVNYYKLDRFCNMYRTSKWKRDSKIQNPEESARKESKCSFGIVVEVSDQEEEDVRKTTESLKNICYEKENIAIVFSSLTKTLPTQVLINQIHNFMDLNIDCQLVVHSGWSQKEEKDKDAFTPLMTKSRNYLIKIEAGQTIDGDFFNFIDTDVNKVLNMTTYFQDVDRDVSAIAFGVVNSQYPNYLDYDLMLKEMRKLSIDQKSYREYEKKN